MHNVKVKEVCFIGRLSEDVSPGGSLSDPAEGLLPRGGGRGGEPGYTGV